MKSGLKFLPRNTRDQSTKSVSERRYQRAKGKTLKHILIDRFLYNYGYEKGGVTANAIVEDILSLIEQYYRYTDNSFLKEGQLVWPCVPINEYPAKGKTMHQTALIPVVLDFISTSDIEDMKTPMHHREIRLKKCERWTQQAYDQGALLSNLDLGILLCVSEHTAALYVQEYYRLYNRHLPTRGHIQSIGGGQTHKQIIIKDYLDGYLVPKICERSRHSKDAVERYIRDFEAVRLLASKFDDINTISLITRLSSRVIAQYLDIIPHASEPG